MSRMKSVLIRGILEGFCKVLLSVGDFGEAAEEVYAGSCFSGSIFAELLAELIVVGMAKKVLGG